MAHDITHYTQRPDIQKVYTTRELADLLNTTDAQIRNIANYYHIEYKVIKTQKSRAMIFDYDAARLVKARHEVRLQKKKQLAITERQAPTEIEKLEDHRLVTDKRCLNLNYWPDTTPDCFKEVD